MRVNFLILGEVSQVIYRINDEEIVEIMPKGNGTIYYLNSKKYNNSLNNKNEIYKMTANFNDHFSVVDGFHQIYFKKLIWIAEFKQNVKNANKGILVFRDGKIFSGNFLFDENTYIFTPLKGILKSNSDKIYQGEIIKGYFNGEGVLFEPEFEQLGFKDSEAINFVNIDNIEINDKDSKLVKFKEINNSDPAPNVSKGHSFFTQYSNYSVNNSHINKDISFVSAYSKTYTTSTNMNVFVNLEKLEKEIPEMIDLNKLEDNMIWGNGTYKKGFFLNGQLHGAGMIITSKKSIQTYWRYGKLISSTEKIRSSKKIPSKILEFLSINEIVAISTIKNSSCFNFIKNNKKIQFDILVAKLYLSDMEKCKNILLTNNNFSQTKQKYIKLDNMHLLLSNINFNLLFKYNPLLRKLKDDNLKRILYLMSENKFVFLPLTPFRTNGGCVSKKMHYSNIFNPSTKRCYYSSFYTEKKTDILVSATVDVNYINESCILSQENLINKNKIGNIPEFNIRKALDKTKNYSAQNNINFFLPQFEKITKTEFIPDFTDFSNIVLPKPYYLENLPFEYDFDVATLDDYEVLKLKTDNDSEFIFSMLYLNNYNKPANFTVLHNPLRTVAIFISNNHILNPEQDSIFNYLCFRNINSFDLKQISNVISERFDIININESEKNWFIEVDSNNSKFNHQQSNYFSNDSELKLLGVARLNTFDQHVFLLKALHHYGKFIYLKLIDQNYMEGFNVNTLDLVSFLAFGNFL